jgi:hypothetical protein
MRRHLEAENPKLGSLEPIGLSFARLRTMFVGLDGSSLGWAAEPLAAVNKIRNKFAHRLDAEIDDQDIRPLVNFLGQLDRSGATVSELQKDPAAIVEIFAVIFGLIVAAFELASKKLAANEDRLRALNEESRTILEEFLGAIENQETDGV